MRPKIVCVCGSTRFTREMMILVWEYAKQGIIAVGWCVLPDGYFPEASHGAKAEGVKRELDELHKRKIDMSDEVHVLNVGGYVGESTTDEVAYAYATRKPVRWFDPEAKVAQYFEDKNRDKIAQHVRWVCPGCHAELPTCNFCPRCGSPRRSDQVARIGAPRTEEEARSEEAVLRLARYWLDGAGECGAEHAIRSARDVLNNYYELVLRPSGREEVG